MCAWARWVLCDFHFVAMSSCLCTLVPLVCARLARAFASYSRVCLHSFVPLTMQGEVLRGWSSSPEDAALEGSPDFVRLTARAHGR